MRKKRQSIHSSFLALLFMGWVWVVGSSFLLLFTGTPHSSWLQVRVGTQTEWETHHNTPLQHPHCCKNTSGNLLFTCSLTPEPKLEGALKQSPQRFSSQWGENPEIIQCTCKTETVNLVKLTTQHDKNETTSSCFCKVRNKVSSNVVHTASFF